MTILVTGATGNVGRPLVAQLLADGHQVRALTRDPAAAALPAGVSVVAGNLTGEAGLARAFDGVTAVHLITFGDDYQPLTNGKEIVSLAVEAGVRRVTVLKGDVDRSPLEDEIAASGLAWTFLGPAEFMSNTLEWAPAIRSSGVVRAGFPDAPSAMIHDGDIAAVAAAVLTSSSAEHSGREYWLTGPEVLTPVSQVRILGEVLGRSLEFVALSQDEVVAQWRQEGYGADDIAFFLAMRTSPPEAGCTVLPTVLEVTGRPARSYREWVADNRASFRG
jgi:uncharacterized protein YbjT (DUF2867 family)